MHHVAFTFTFRLPGKISLLSKSFREGAELSWKQPVNARPILTAET